MTSRLNASSFSCSQGNGPDPINKYLVQGLNPAPLLEYWTLNRVILLNDQIQRGRDSPLIRTWKVARCLLPYDGGEEQADGPSSLAFAFGGFLDNVVDVNRSRHLIVRRLLKERLVSTQGRRTPIYDNGGFCEEEILESFVEVGSRLRLQERREIVLSPLGEANETGTRDFDVGHVCAES